VLTTLAINGIMTAWDQRAIFALGPWLLLSPWIIGFSATVPLMWNSVIFGGLIFVFAAGALLTIGPGGRLSHSAGFISLASIGQNVLGGVRRVISPERAMSAASGKGVAVRPKGS
jgi:hypothetical protein